MRWNVSSLFFMSMCASFCLHLSCMPSSPSASLASLPLPCAALLASSLNLSPPCLSHTHVLLPLLRLLLSFPPFSTPFLAGMVPNGSTLID